MPCSRCGSWETNPSWHRCDKANSQGVVKLHTGKIRCSRSWDGTYWFFFCNHCKASRPHIIGVLRNARIWHCPSSRQTDYITDSEGYSYHSSESESCTQEETEEFFSIHEAARAKSLKNKAIECFSTRSITDCVPPWGSALPGTALAPNGDVVAGSDGLSSAED